MKDFFSQNGKSFQVSADNTVNNSEFLEHASQIGLFYLCSKTTKYRGKC